MSFEYSALQLLNVLIRTEDCYNSSESNTEAYIRNKKQRKIIAHQFHLNGKH